MLGGEEADLLAAADDGQVDELGLGGVAFDARTGTHLLVLCRELFELCANALCVGCRAARGARGRAN